MTKGRRKRSRKKRKAAVTESVEKPGCRTEGGEDSGEGLVGAAGEALAPSHSPFHRPPACSHGSFSWHWYCCTEPTVIL